jgi:Tfp pilus assembly protein PilF
MGLKQVLETVMRFAAPAIALAMVLSTVSSVSVAKRTADKQIDPVSKALTQQGVAELTANKLEAATDSLESALVVDPRNREAFVVLAKIALKQDLPGKAIRYYREALLIEPNDIGALAGQGEALAKRGAVTKAKENLARIQRLCVSTCAEQAQLASAITLAEKAPPVVSAQAVTPKPTVTEVPTP